MIEKVSLQNSNSQDDDPLISQPLTLWWVLIGVWWFMLVLVVDSLIRHPHPHDRDPGNLMFLGGFIVLPCLLGPWAILRYKIRADKKGLTFVGLVKEQFIPWQEISDFWLCLPPGKGTQGNNEQVNEASPQSLALVSCVEAGGKAYKLWLGMGSLRELRERIEREAKWAKVRHFDFKETRDGSEWPKTFEYKASARWLLVGQYAAEFLFVQASLLVLMLLMGSGKPGPKSVIPVIVASWSALTAVGKAGLLMQSGLVALVVPLRFLLPLIESWLFRKWLSRSIVATKTGLTFRDGESEEAFVGFEEIESYHFEVYPRLRSAVLCVVETRGQRFEFLKFMSESRILCYIIQDRATRATTKKWRFAEGHDKDTLGTVQQLWGGGSVGLGRRIYHYRTRTNRDLLVMGWVINALIWGDSLYWYFFRSLSRVFNLSNSVVMVFLLAPCIWGTLAWFYSALESDENGLYQRGIWGQRFMKWSDMESYSFDKYFYMLKGKGKPKTMIFGSVANFDTLRTEIEQRAPQSKGSWTGSATEAK